MCSTPVLYWTNIPEKHGKAWRPGMEGPVVGGTLVGHIRPPKMHQISNEVVRDWSLWGSWYFCPFWWFPEIVSGFFWQEVRSFSWMLLSERCFVILLYIVCLCILLYILLYSWVLFLFQIYPCTRPVPQTKTPALLQLEALSEHLLQAAPQKRAAKDSWSKYIGCQQVMSRDGRHLF